MPDRKVLDGIALPTDREGGPHAWGGPSEVKRQGTASGVLAFIMVGGGDVPNSDCGFGCPARVFSVDESRQINDALQSLKDADISSRFDREAWEAAGIYPDIDLTSGTEEIEEYFCYFSHALREFIANGVSQGRGLLVYFVA